MSEESRDRLARPRGRTKAITLSLAQGCWILLFLSSCAGTPASEAGLNQHPTTRASADTPAPERSGRQEQSFSLRLDTARWEADPTTIEMMPAGNTMGNVTRVGGKRKGSSLLTVVYLAFPDHGASDTTVHLEKAESSTMMMFKGPKGTMYMTKYIDLHVWHSEEAGHAMLNGTFSGELTDLLNAGHPLIIHDGTFKVRAEWKHGSEAIPTGSEAPLTWVANGVAWQARSTGFTDIVGKEGGDSTWIASMAFDPSVADKDGLLFVKVALPYPTGNDSTVRANRFRNNFGIEFMKTSREGRVQYRSKALECDIRKEWSGDRVRLVAHFNATMVDVNGVAVNIRLSHGVLLGGWKKPGLFSPLPE